jgi:predicted nucleic acid-binding protein
MNRVFVDTGAWFALYVTTDPDHSAAKTWHRQNRRLPLVTTDFVLDELLTLFKARKEYPQALDFGLDLFTGSLCDLEWVTRSDVSQAWRDFSSFRDKDWSFTDCVSRVVMSRLGIVTAFAFDRHFHEFGSVQVVPSRGR